MFGLFKKGGNRKTQRRLKKNRKSRRVRYSKRFVGGEDKQDGSSQEQLVSRRF
jgi:hypothetical protein